MMSAWWLTLIIPAAFYFGFFTSAVMHYAKENWRTKENWHDKDKK